MGDELSCITELLCCCILLEDCNQNYERNNYNTINNPRVNYMERSQTSNGSNGSNESNGSYEQEYYIDNEGNYVTIVEGEPLLKNTFRTVKIKKS